MTKAELERQLAESRDDFAGAVKKIIELEKKEGEQTRRIKRLDNQRSALLEGIFALQAIVSVMKSGNSFYSKDRECYDYTRTGKEANEILEIINNILRNEREQ